MKINYTFLFFIFSFNLFGQNEKCLNIYVWDFETHENQKNNFTRKLTSAIEEELVNSIGCVVLQRRYFSSLQIQFENERNVTSIRNMKAAFKDSLSIIRAQLVIFGELDMKDSINFLRVRVESLDKGSLEAMESIEIRVADIYNNTTVKSITEILITKLLRKESKKSKESLNKPELLLVKGGKYDGNKVEDFHLGKFEVTIYQFNEFINETGYKTDAEKINSSMIVEGWGRTFSQMQNINWRYNESGKIRPQTEWSYPVIHVSWNDAITYCQWLSKKIGKQIRLPTDLEWNYAASNGKGNLYSWGNEPKPSFRAENLADETLREKFPNLDIFTGYNDGFVQVSPVGFFKPNLLGIYDIGGNISEWCLDSYNKANELNSKTGGDKHVIKGGNWRSGSDTNNNSRYGNSSNYTDCTLGFRIAYDN